MSGTDIKEVFLEEAKEILQNLESDIVKLEENFSTELVNNIFRYVHTLKGSSGIAGLDEIHKFAHELENLMDAIRSGKMEVDEGITDLLLDSLDWVRTYISGSADEAESDKARALVLEKISGYMTQLGLAGKAQEDEQEKSEEKTVKEGDSLYNFYGVRAKFRGDIFEQGIDPLIIMEDLASLGTVVEKRLIRKNLPDFENLDPEKCYLAWDLVLKTKHSFDEVMGVFIFVKDDEYNEISVEDITRDFIGEGDKYLRDKKLGEIMTEKGILTEREREQLLIEQARENKKLGELIIEKGYATEEDLEYALEKQDELRNKIETSTVRVDTGKLDRLMNLLGEIVIGQSAITRLSDELQDEKGFRLKNALYGLDRITREFQEQLMSIRMIPIGPTFDQFRRFVRDISHSVGKNIKLEIEGEETELDKTVIEKISDPLKHMIRNAIDHGIESLEDRKKAGKPETGRIKLRAYHQEGNVFIEVTDDGRGIDKVRIRARAEQMGLLNSEEEASESKLHSFLFIPGFSTSANVGDLSGRGVGMDVVRTNVESLRGAVEIDSREGEGTTFRIKLPLTLAIIEGMLVRVGGQVYIIPLLSIVESIQPSKEEVKTVEGKGEVIKVRGDYITLLKIYELFNMKPDYTNPWECLVVIVESGGEKVGLMIDDLMGQQQIVIKSLENEITYSRAISGAAILGDGRVALILDIHGLIGDVKSQ